MSSFLSEVKGFTPVIDVLVAEVGLITANVYGVVWRYCQMETGVCTASLETIAHRIGSSRKTAERHIKRLVKQGYLADLTPNLKHKPHTYADTGRIKINGLVEASLSIGETESPTSDGDRSDRKSHQVGQKVSPGRTESPTRSDRESYKESLHDTSYETLEETGPADAGSAPEPEQSQTPAQAMFEALATVCAWDIELITDKQRGQLNQTEARLRKMRGQAVTPADVLAFGNWWAAHDWRGKKGEFPRPDQVRAEWGRFQNWQRERAKVQAKQDETRRQAEARRAELETEEADVDPDLALARKTWIDACEQLAGGMTRGTYAAYIRPLEVLKPNGAFRLAAPREDIRDWLEHRLRPSVENALAGVVGRDVQVEFVVRGS